MLHERTLLWACKVKKSDNSYVDDIPMEKAMRQSAGECLECQLQTQEDKGHGHPTLY